MQDVTLAPVLDFGAVGARWGALARVAEAGPFLSWQFVGTHAAVRFEAPFLLAVREGGADVALALLNRAGGRFFLNATGDAGRDSVFIEHNGLLGRAGDVARVLEGALRAVVGVAPLVVAGVDDGFLGVAAEVGVVTRRQARFAPAVDLAAVRSDFVETLSANARGQIRRAMRLCGGDLAVARAGDVGTALDWFAEMVALHAASWRARGRPGAFADAAVVGFHADLIAAGQADGTAEILRVRGGGRTVGVLYMLRQGGLVCSYQSGFAVAVDGREKPGLVSHVKAIEFYRSEGAERYDLLAGAARYKATLAGTGGQMLHWFTLDRAGAVGARARRLAELVGARVGLKERLP